MRFRTKFSIVTFLLICAGLLCVDRDAVTAKLVKPNQVIHEDARESNANRMTMDEWSEFVIPRKATTLRLLTNAAMEQDNEDAITMEDPRFGFRYAIEYQLLDRRGQVLTQSVYHFRSGVRRLLDSKSGYTFNPILIQDSDLICAQTRALQLGITNFERPASILRARLFSTDSSVRVVAARVLARVERNDYEDRGTWNRLSSPTRESICKYCVYDQELLTTFERTNLIRWRWIGTSTLGTKPEFKISFIGDIDDRESKDIRQQIGVIAESGRDASIPLPSGAGELELSFDFTDPSEPASEIIIKQFDEKVANRTEREVIVQPGKTKIRLHVDGGIIQVRSLRRVGITASWNSLDTERSGRQEDSVDVTPQSFLTKSYVVDQRAVDFRVNHIDNEPTPWKLSVRFPYDHYFGNGEFDESLQTLEGLVVEQIDSQGHVVGSYPVSVPNTISRFDHLPLPGGHLAKLSEPVVVYFRLPENVTQLRLRSSGGRYLVNSYTRLNQLPRTIRVPEDYRAIEKHAALNRSWFLVNSPQENELIKANRVFVVGGQSKPPIVNADFATGKFRWQSYTPEGDWIARELLVPQDDSVKMRYQAFDASHYLLNANQTYQFEMPKEAVVEDRAPVKLIVIGDQPAGRIDLRINGESAYVTNVDSNRAEIRIDQPLERSGRLSVSTELPAKIFVSGRNVAKAVRYLKRTAQCIQDGSIEFKYQKQTPEEELVTIQLYRNAQGSERSRVKATILPIKKPAAPKTKMGPFDSWTIQHRVFDLAVKPSPYSYVLGSDITLDTGQKCFLRLGAELAPGRYTIKLTPINSDEKVYTLMYQAKPGNDILGRKLRVIQNRQPQ